MPGCTNTESNRSEAEARSRSECKDPSGKCPDQPKLVKITVIKYATQTDVTGAKNWACVKKATNDVIIEATTSPSNTSDEWAQIKWSGDSGAPVPGKLNQRKLSRADSKKLHIEAELGGVKDDLFVWVLGGTVTIKTSGTTPANAVQFGASLDGTENLGPVIYNGNTIGRGKIVAIGKLTPAGVNAVVKSGWELKRERMSHDWKDGAKNNPGNGASDYWNTAWVDDTSNASWKKLTPDASDQIYDNDGPNIARFGTNDAETYNNFKQWVEWHEGDADTGGACTDKAEWYFQGRWKASAAKQVELTDVGTGSIALPNSSHYHP